MMYILATVRMSLLDMIMMITMTLPVVRYIKISTDTGAWYCLKELGTHLCLSFCVPVRVNICVLNGGSTVVCVFVDSVIVYIIQ